MCKMAEILPGTPGRCAKPHKTHMKRTGRRQAERYGKIITNEEWLGSTAASSRAHRHPPSPYGLVCAHEPGKLLVCKGYANTNTSTEGLGLEKGRACE